MCQPSNSQQASKKTHNTSQQRKQPTSIKLQPLHFHEITILSCSTHLLFVIFQLFFKVCTKTGHGFIFTYKAEQC